ncbi:helix-turn-helix domain-containing protein [Actinomycetospora sp. CA-101289]|uniref:helix-turn-helix domain-containing protein n=1 Tax=Actinomycetospora sp. CA-101289 TaxID=3239893 RepID=UPI003D98E465
MTSEDQAGADEVDDLADMLEDLSRRLAAIDEHCGPLVLAGDDPAAAENRSIRGAQAHLVRAETRALRAEVAEVRARAREMARGARRVQERARPARLDADGLPVDALARLCRQALAVGESVSWARITVPTREGGVRTPSAGTLAPAAAEAVTQGPCVLAARSGTPIAVDDVAGDPRWPGLRAGDPAPASLLVVPLGAGTGGTLALAAGTRAAFPAPVRAVAAEVARHVGRFVAARAAGHPVPPDPAGRARDLVAAARALLARHDRVAPDVAFDALLERAVRSGVTLLACAGEVVDELGPVPGEDAAPGPPPEPATLRRALAYLEEHAGEDVDVADVAAAAGLGVRGLQTSFRRWRDTTPLAHLRHLRLGRAHDELLAADPRRGATVADIAARWGFTHAGRFSVVYRRRYGCSPSETLRA